jgi:hypothetical protein
MVTGGVMDVLAFRKELADALQAMHGLFYSGMHMDILLYDAAVGEAVLRLHHEYGRVNG